MQKSNQVINLASMRGVVDDNRSKRSNGGGERRRQILEAAGRALADVGFEEITTRRIAREAGVNIATLHYHFGSKEALLAEALRHALSQAERYLREVMAMGAAATPAGALEAGFTAIYEIVSERPGMLRYDLVLRALRHEGARAEAQAVYAVYRQMVEELVQWHQTQGGTLAPGVTAPILAHYAVTAVDGILLQHLITGDDAATKNSLDLVRRHALSLLNAGEGRDGTNHE